MLDTGRLLGDFEIIRPLGRGGMGEVYEAQQFHPPRRVALKVLAPWLAEDEAALERFRREAEAPAQLDHPNIVRIFATGAEAGLAFYTMQLVRGLSLSELIRRASSNDSPTVTDVTKPDSGHAPEVAPEGGAFAGAGRDGEPPMVQLYRRDRFTAVVRLGLQAARALAAAHAQGVLHRDLKPSNLMVDRHDQLYVVDFGLTKSLQPDGDESSCGFVRGTPWYMSPEQARGEAVRVGSDLYSLGVTLYELCSGGVGPYNSDRRDRAAVLQEVRQGAALPLHRLSHETPTGLQRVVERAMNVDPGRRYASAAELVKDLEALSAAPEPAAPPSSGRRRRVALFASGAVGALALALVLLAAFLPARPNADSNGSQRVGGEISPKDDPNPLPQALRERLPHHAVTLLRDDHRPLWSALLMGEGKCQPLTHQMVLASYFPSLPTLLALDDDPKRNWFEFKVRIQKMNAGREWANEHGLFFGWRRDRRDSDYSYRFFIVQLDDTPLEAAPNGRAIIGTMLYRPSRGTEGAHFQWLVPLPGGKATLVLPPFTNKACWRDCSVRAVDRRITVAVDGVSRTFEPDDYEALHKRLGGGPLDARGALGVWARQGQGSFKEGTVTAVPSIAER